MAIKIKNLRISPYTDKNELKVIFGDELKLTFEIPHVDGESYLCALDCDRILYPINRPVCAYTEVFTRDGDNVNFTLNLTTSKLRDYVSSIKKPMPVWLQIVREVNGKYETVLLDDILAIPSVIDGSMTVYEGDSFKELLDAKMNVPEAEGADGQVLTMDADGHYSWQDLPEQEQADWDESDSEKASYIKNKPNLAINDGKITVNQGGVKKGEFTVNQAGDTTIDLNDGAQSDWDESDSSDVSFIKNKPALATVATSGSYNDLTDKPIITQPVNADWDESDSENLAYIFNKPTIPAAQVQADYAQNDNTQIDYIKNKPEIIDATDYLCFTPITRIAQDITVTLNAVGNAPSLNLEYSKDRRTWTSYTVGTAISLSFIAANKFESVWFRGDNLTMATGWNVCHTFALAGAAFAVTGNIMSLLKKDCKQDIVPTYGFAFLFNGCANLVSAPKLPASLVYSYGYARMFQGCTSLEETPELPAIRLTQYCYGGMFNGCASLKKAHDLPALNGENTCYGGMFQNCTSLKEAPVINANLYNSCSEYMFDGCTSLNHVKVNFTNFNGATNSWMSSVAASGVFECPSALYISTRGASTVPDGWTVVRYDAPQSDWNQTDTLEASYIKNKPDLSTKLDAPTTAGTAGQVLTKTADGQEWADVGEDKTDYLCFESEDAGNIVRLDKNKASMADVDLEFSFDRKNWTTYTWNGTTGYQIDLNAGDTVCFRGNNSSFSTSSSNYFKFGFGWNKMVKASGNLASLLSKDLSVTSLMSKNYVFYLLFDGCQFLKTAPKLPFNNLSESCYEGMFRSCSRLEVAPDLPDNSPNVKSYKEMFRNCTSLTKVPRFSKDYMNSQCYSGMFMGCTSLTEAPDLNVNSLASFCFNNMFSGCTSLTKIGALNNTTLAEYCYSGMFSGCTSLTQMPDLPATTLTRECYRNMFANCTSLKTAEFKATNVSAQNCCWSMFSGCTNLTFVKTHFSGTIGYNALNDFLANASAYGVFENPNTLSYTSFLPAGWIIAPNANIPDKGTTSSVETSSGDTYCICPSSKETGVLTVASALTLNAMTTASTEIAYAEIVLDVAANATVTAGTNITFVDTLTAGKRNVCVVRWADGTAKLYVTITEDIPQA